MTYKTNQFLDNHFLSYTTVVANSIQSQDQAVFVKVGDPSAGAALRSAVRSYPDVKGQTAPSSRTECSLRCSPPGGRRGSMCSEPSPPPDGPNVG
ncbi:MAG: hypothetical protein NVS3B12_19360 [Acidimicrobiales bacterium]